MSGRNFIIFTILILFLTACNLSGASTATPAVMGDTIFRGCAFLDTNGNGSIDSQDAPIGGMNFTVTLSKGAGFGGITVQKDGCASVLIPASLSEADWPVWAKMEIPTPLRLVPVGENKARLEYPNNRVDFLFTQP